MQRTEKLALIKLSHPFDREGSQTDIDARTLQLAIWY